MNIVTALSSVRPCVIMCVYEYVGGCKRMYLVVCMDLVFTLNSFDLDGRGNAGTHPSFGVFRCKTGQYYSQHGIEELVSSKLLGDLVLIDHMMTEVMHVATHVTQPNIQEWRYRSMR